MSNAVHEGRSQDRAGERGLVAWGRLRIVLHPLTRPPLVSLLPSAAIDAHSVTWCCIQKPCNNSGAGQ
jgi:hypothetical protein